MVALPYSPTEGARDQRGRSQETLSVIPPSSFSHPHPPIFVSLVKIVETSVAVGPNFGFFSNLTTLTDPLLSAVIWFIAEGSDGLNASGSTDIGAVIIYILVFAGLFPAGYAPISRGAGPGAPTK